ncbi:hypothetical protein HG531_012774 [Fusarium graminearum]|nr:hypothetical protein HG531_012774 [Fusarium graminearum]
MNLPTYILLNLERNLGDLLLVANIALVVRNTSRLGVLHLIHIQHRHCRAAHAIHLRNEQTQPASTSSDDNNLLAQINLTWDAMSDALIDHIGHPEKRDYSGPRNGGHHRRSLPFHRLRAEAQWNNPTDKRVQKSRVEDLQDEVN